MENQIKTVRDFLVKNADVLGAPRDKAGEPLILVVGCSAHGVRAAVCGGGRDKSEGQVYERAQAVLTQAGGLVDCPVNLRCCIRP